MTMIVKQQKIERQRSATRQFLVYKTEPVTAKPHINRPPKKPPVGLKELSDRFPNLRKGKPFIDFAMSRLEASLCFSAMLIRIDDFATKEAVSGKAYAAKLLIDVAAAIEAACRAGNGIWGLIERDLFGCFFQESHQPSGYERRPEAIRSAFTAPRNETLTIGIALYPIARFSRLHTLKNARKALDHASFYGPGGTAVFDAMSLSISGDKLYQQGDVRKAIEEFNNALLLDPSNANIHNSLGVCYGVLGALQSALEAFETGTRLNPSELMPVYNAGLVSMMMGKNEKALEYLIRAGEIDTISGGGVYEVAFQTGKLYLEMNRPEKARSFFERAVRLKPDAGGVVYRMLGESYAALNMVDEAAIAYKKAIRRNPDDSESISALGCLFDLQGENPEIAIMFCRYSTEMEPENGLFHQRLGKLYLKQGRFEEAVREFETATRLGLDSIRYIEEIHIRQNKAC